MSSVLSLVGLQDRNRSNRDGHNKQKKATKGGSSFSGLLDFFSGGDFRSWLMYFLVVVGIVGRLRQYVHTSCISKRIWAFAKMCAKGKRVSDAS